MHLDIRCSRIFITNAKHVAVALARVYMLFNLLVDEAKPKFFFLILIDITRDTESTRQTIV